MRVSASIHPKKPRLFRLRHGLREVLLGSGTLTLGRKSSCDYVLHDTKVSREHARIIVGEKTIAVEDLGSANGVFVNEKPVDGLRRLSEGDQLRIGSQIFDVSEVREEASTGEPDHDDQTVVTRNGKPSLFPLDEEYEDRPTRVLQPKKIEPR